VDESVTPSGDPERWLPVVGFEGRYEVSDLGRVRSLPRKWAKGGLMKPCLNQGYLIVRLSRNARTRSFAIHCLVAEAFLGRRPEGMQVCHGPGGMTDNRLVNLSYGTLSKNNGADRWRDGTMPAGIRSGRAKLTDEIVLECRVRAATGVSRSTLAREFGVGKTTITRLVQGHTWKHVPFPDTMESSAA
jgi:hypothetical protein